MTQINGIIFTGNGISFVLDGKPYTIHNTHTAFEDIKDAIRNKDYDSVFNLISPTTSINKFLPGEIEVIGESIFYNGEQLPSVLEDRIIQMIREGFDYVPFVNFWKNLNQNTSKTAIDELYLFLESGKMPITEDGHFLAYKRIRKDWKDIYSGTIDHSIGSKPKMERKDVCDNRHKTCSYGLHFCSLNYLPSYRNGADSRVVIVKINPKDVVSIPSDYNNTKGRCCTYEVIAEIPEPETNVFVKSVMNWDDEDFEEDYDDSWDGYLEDDTPASPTYNGHQLKLGYTFTVSSSGQVCFRDSDGKFVSKNEALV